jgi:hypothetical protein
MTTEVVVKQLYNSFRDEISSKIKNKETNPLLWVGTVTKMMITIETLVKQGNEKSQIIIQVLCNMIDNELSMEHNDKESTKVLIQTLIPTVIDNIILATKTIHVNKEKCCPCF